MQLAKFVSVAPRFSRSINLERDAHNVEALDGYLLTSSGRQVLERVCNAITGTAVSRQRAWTLTGPYGSGKSAFALFLAAVLGDGGATTTIEARRILREQDEDLYRQLFDKRRRNSIGQGGYCAVLVSGSTEPLLDRLLEACVRDLGKQITSSRQVRDFDALEVLNKRRKSGKEIDPSKFVTALSAVSQQLRKRGRFAGILILIDELGKFLEFSARAPEQSEIFLLQQLAEASVEGTGLVLVTILHQAFERYAAGLRVSMREEWAKIQGRFEDIAFQEPPEQMLLLVGEAIRHASDPRIREIRATAKKLGEQAWELQLAPSGLGKREFVELLGRCAPLHPLTVLVLARLCRKFGQNQRSLFAFLVSREPHAFSSFLESATTASPFYQLADLYDYVADNFGAGLTVGENATRWAEVQSALDRAAMSSITELRLIKTIGLLSAIGVFGNLKASPEILEFALGGEPRQTRAGLAALLKTSVLVNRKHSGVVALWQGSDVDLEARSGEARRRVDTTFLSSKLSISWQTRPLIAKRHSYQTGTLRYFDVRFAGVDEFWSNVAPSDGADGLIVYCLPQSEAEYDQLKELASSSPVRDRPDILVAIPRDIEQLKDCARDLEILNWISNNTPELAGDAVSRRELHSRKALAEIRLTEEVSNLFSPESPIAKKTRWYHRGIEQSVTNTRSLASFLSDICDYVFPHTPRLRNELLNRRHLSSAAAAARRNLIDYMITKSAEASLGLSGNPPEMSMYASVLRATGIHRQDGDSWVFGEPQTDPGLRKVWDAIERFFVDCELRRRPVLELFDILQQPPYGLKMGLVPVLFCAASLAHDTEIALYENDVFVPELSVELFERLLRTPGNFKLRRYNIVGVRRNVFQDFAALLTTSDQKTPEQSIVAVVRPLFRFLNRLPEYTRQTKSLTLRALNVREALFASREPDALLFEELPKACGFEAFGTLSDTANVAEFFGCLRGALNELQRTYDELLSDLERLLFAAFGAGKNGYREVLRFRSQRVLDHAVDPRLKAFSYHLCEEQLEDVLWIEAIGTLVVGKPPRSWNDTDRAKYEVQLMDLVRNFRHVEALAFEISRRPDTGGVPAEVIRIGVTDAHSKDVEAVVAVEREDQQTLAHTVFELESCLERLGMQDNPNLSLAALAVVCRKFLDDFYRNKSELETSKIKGALNV